MKFRNHLSSTNFYLRTTLCSSLLALLAFTACEVEDPIPTYTLTTTISPTEGGKITVSPQATSYPEGSQVTLTPEANENWVFKQWEGDAEGSTTPLQFTMSANKAITGVFIKRDYPLNIKIEGEGTVEEKIVPNPSGREYPHGTTVELSPKPKEGWEFDAWSGDLTGNEVPKRITVDKQKNVIAKFKGKTLTNFKNYLQTSYELQKSNVNIDLVALRKDNGQKTGQVLAIAYLDINGDGYDDIFINAVYGTNSTERSFGEIYIFNKLNGKYQLDNSFFNTGQIPSLIHPRKALVGDYNNDGKPDIFITGHGWDQNSFPGEYAQLLLSENGKYKLVEFKDKIGFYHGACSGDIDKDGDLDIFVLGGSAFFNSGNNSYFLINDGKGNFTYSTKEIDISKLGGQFHCELFDIDRDGYLDLILGGHEFEVKDPTFIDNKKIEGSTRIYWGNNLATYDFNSITNIPIVTNWGTITDLDFADLNNDNKFELAITRTGGLNSNNQINYFYQGWNMQIIKIENRKATDITTSSIEQNSSLLGYSQGNPWMTWMRFEDYDNNNKIDFFSTKCGNADFVRWELLNGKLVRVK